MIAAELMVNVINSELERMNTVRDKTLTTKLNNFLAKVTKFNVNNINTTENVNTIMNELTVDDITQEIVLVFITLVKNSFLLNGGNWADLHEHVTTISKVITNDTMLPETRKLYNNVDIKIENALFIILNVLITNINIPLTEEVK